MSRSRGRHLSGPVLRDTARLSQRSPPSLRAMGFLVSQHGQLGAIPPPPFLSISPFESMRSGGAIPPLKRGISAILARYPLKTRQMGAIPPSAILSRGGIARYGGVSRTGPLSPPPKPPPKIPKDPPLFVWECRGVHSTMERPVFLGGGMGFFWGGGRGGNL